MEKISKVEQKESISSSSKIIEAIEGEGLYNYIDRVVKAAKDGDITYSYRDLQFDVKQGDYSDDEFFDMMEKAEAAKELKNELDNHINAAMDVKGEGFKQKAARWLRELDDLRQRGAEYDVSELTPVLTAMGFFAMDETVTDPLEKKYMEATYAMAKGILYGESMINYRSALDEYIILSRDVEEEPSMFKIVNPKSGEGPISYVARVAGEGVKEDVIFNLNGVTFDVPKGKYTEEQLGEMYNKLSQSQDKAV